MSQGRLRLDTQRYYSPNKQAIRGPAPVPTLQPDNHTPRCIRKPLDHPPSPPPPGPLWAW